MKKLSIKLLSIPLLLFTASTLMLAFFSPKIAYGQEGYTPSREDLYPEELETRRQFIRERFGGHPAVQDKPTIDDILVQTINAGDTSGETYIRWAFNNFGNSTANAIFDRTAAQTTGTYRGAIPAMTKMIAGTIGSPPVFTGTYIADIMDNMGIVTPAYAQDQGTGWTALTAVLKIWKAFRNIAYLGFVIIFVVVGFMIMFRAQVNPQTVVTIQAALPKIVFTLLLVTFSYAIASLMIDFIYVLIYLMVGVLEAFGVIQSGRAGNVVDMLLESNGFLLVKLLSPRGAAGTAADAIGDLVQGIVDVQILDRVFNWISDILAYVIIAVAILIAMFKLFFQLLMAYIGIIFSVIFAPITLLFNALPNSNSFSSWLKGLFANAIIFPIVALLFVLAGALTGTEGMYIAEGIGHQAGSLETGRQLVLPFVGGGFDTDAIQALIGIGFIMIMPKIVEMVQKMLGIEGGMAGMAGAAMAPIAGAWGGMRGAGTMGLDFASERMLTRGPKPARWLAEYYRQRRGFDIADYMMGRRGPTPGRGVGR